MSESGIRNLIWGLIFSGFAMTLHGSSRPASGAEHMFSHALDRLGSFGLHGEQVGIGTIFFSCLQEQDWRKIQKLLSDLSAQTKAADLKIPQDVLVKTFLEAKKMKLIKFSMTGLKNWK